MKLLDRLYEAQNMDLGDIQVIKDREIDVIKLRAILDNVIEQLPPLLELGNVPRVRKPLRSFILELGVNFVP